MVKMGIPLSQDSKPSKGFQVLSPKCAQCTLEGDVVDLNDIVTHKGILDFFNIIH